MGDTGRGAADCCVGGAPNPFVSSHPYLRVYKETCKVHVMGEVSLINKAWGLQLAKLLKHLPQNFSVLISSNCSGKEVPGHQESREQLED